MLEMVGEHLLIAALLQNHPPCWGSGHLYVAVHYQPDMVRRWQGEVLVPERPQRVEVDLI